jgi:hypothetical protein
MRSYAPAAGMCQSLPPECPPERRVRSVLLIVVLLMGFVALPPPARGAEPARKVAIIVGPVGEKLTPTYIAIAETAARRAEANGALVARAYSPNATPNRVLAAVEGANVVIYLGHGVGVPNPYSKTPDATLVNGWGLQGPKAHGNHDDSWASGALAYYGEAWIAANAHPAPGWVMIYSNACYAPGASEGFDVQASPEVAAQRVGSYSRVPLTELGASAYFATDFFEGAAQLVGTILEQPQLPYGQIFAADPRFDATAVTRGPNPAAAHGEIWLQHSPYFDGKSDYWYGFAGNPDATPAGTFVEGASAALGVRAGALKGPLVTPLLGFDGVAVGRASSYSESPGWEGQATVALPVEIGGEIPVGAPRLVEVCGDRCVTLPVVDSCPCYVGTPDQRVANLSHEAWRLVTDDPLEEGLVDVRIVLAPQAPTTSPQGPNA